MMNLQVLSDRLLLENSGDKLSDMGPTFYDEAGDYLKSLQDKRRCSKNHVEMSQVDDEDRAARILIEQIYDKRIGKIKNYASIVATGTKIATDNMMPKERIVYNEVLSIIKTYRDERLGPIMDVTDSLEIPEAVVNRVEARGKQRTP